MKNKDNNAITFKERASFYDVEYDDERDSVMLKHFIGQAENILEIPCGSGRNANLYQDTNAKVTLIDIEEEMINIVKEKTTGFKNITCKVADLLNLNLTDQFDLILLPKESLQLFINDSDVRLILSSLRRHLDASGIIFVDIFNFNKSCVSDDIPQYFDANIQENTYFKNWRKGDMTRLSKIVFNNDILEVSYKYEIGNAEEKQIMTSDIKLKIYTYLEFCNICEDCGLTIEASYGNYNFDTYTPDHNRMIFILRKE